MGLLEWLRNQIRQVPRELEVCEFRCARNDCRHGDWETCDWRRQGEHPGRRSEPPQRLPSAD